MRNSMFIGLTGIVIGVVGAIMQTTITIPPMIMCMAAMWICKTIEDGKNKKDGS